MTSYTTISAGLVAVGAKPFATTIQALRDNPIAMFEGDATAIAAGQTLLDAALDTGAATAAGRTWVGLRTANLAAGAVGSYALLSNNDTAIATNAPGGTFAGSNLRYASVSGANSGTPAGTWRSVGRHETHNVINIPLNDMRRTTLFLRIS